MLVLNFKFLISDLSFLNKLYNISLISLSNKKVNYVLNGLRKKHKSQKK